MIKINLLDSVTERHSGAAVAVERKMSSPTSKLVLMAVAVGFLLAAVIGWDVISANMAKTAADAELAEQQRIASELEAVMKEQTELQAKINNIDARINAIKKLRDSQAGPSAVLESLRERASMVPGLYLVSVEQTGDQLIIKGNSPNEDTVTQFGRSLEFSNGLFSNLNIEFQRKEETNQAVQASAQGETREAPKVAVLDFTIKCAYTASKAAPKDGQTTAANAAPAAGAPGAAAPPQVAKK
jgi:Tfp pilus assembly protein PilN